ncbi:MAG TPA: hypothetical protein VH476_04820 [Solirubrobacterales bacterium]
MLGLGPYLLGAAALALLAITSWLGAAAARARLAPELTGVPSHLATSVIATALVIWVAELLGTLGWFAPVPYLAVVAVVGVGLWRLLPGVAWGEGGRGRPRPQSPPHPMTGPPDRSSPIQALAATLIGLIAVALFIPGVRDSLSTGMTGFDSTWYHGPFAAGFYQSGNTWDLHFIAPQFLAWFYPANAEIFHAIGMLAFDRDLISPLLNLGWFIGCLFALWSIGRRFRVGAYSLLLGALILTAPLLSDQAGEARNDIVAIFFLLVAIAVLLNARSPAGGAPARLSEGALLVAGLAVGLAAGTKLNYLLPSATLLVGVAVAAPAGTRRRALGVGTLAAIAGGGYWYLRNLFHTGNPLPWFTDLGPLSLPGPEQNLGGREGHSVLGYLTDGSVWSEWFLPGLHHGLTIFWPLLGALALAGLLLALGPRADPYVRVTGAVGLAAALAWLVAPTSASGPDGIPRGFESGLRYLAPALVLGMSLLPIVVGERLRDGGVGRLPNRRILKTPTSLGRRLSGREMPRTPIAMVAALAAIAIGYPVQRHYLENRYRDPTFAAPGLNAVFAATSRVSGERIATTSTRQYPLFGTDLSNRVEYIGRHRPDGGFVAPTSCREWRRLIDAGHYEYVVASRDRIEPGRPPYPASARWTEGPHAKLVLAIPPTKVFKLSGRLDPSACP